MIPKIIHYCWFGGNPLDDKGKKCISSWKKFFPDYRIIEWNESNFDVTCCKYVKEAYEAKKWAFVSDYVRFKVLYEFGGFYFDTDVEVIKPFEDIITKGNYMGYERERDNLNPGLGMAVAPGLDIIKEMISDYEKSSFLREDGTYDLKTIVVRTTEMLKKYGLNPTLDFQTVAEINIYPREYFCPIDLETGRLQITENTHSIHWYAGSWVHKKDLFRSKAYQLLNRYFGKRIATMVKKVFRRM